LPGFFQREGFRKNAWHFSWVSLDERPGLQT
jgi:hypothetical protein